MTFQLPEALQAGSEDQALSYLNEYFHSGRYTGASFDVWHSDPRLADETNRFTSDDLVAVSFLSVRVVGAAALELLAPNDNPYNALLSEIGSDRDLADQAEPPSPSDPAWQLDQRLQDLPRVGRTIASKLMARKRPRLVPIFDTVVDTVMSLRPQHWIPLHAALRADDGLLQQRLLELRARADLPAGISALRVLDVVAWMEGKARGVVDPEEEDLPPSGA